MTVYELESGGIQRPLTIDGVDFPIAIGSLSIDPAPIEVAVDTIDGGSTSFMPLSFQGAPNVADRYTITVPITTLKGASLTAIERSRARGGYHVLAYWRPIRVSWTARVGQTLFYLRKYRRNAPQALAGLVDAWSGIAMSTTVAPFKVWINDVPKTVSYAAGPDLTDPGAGNVVVASLVATDGAAKDHAALMVGDALVAGDVVEVEFFPLFLVTLTAPKINYPRSVVEDHSYTFRER